jgi:UDP-2,3-diacylglucosamine hydrolase
MQIPAGKKIYFSSDNHLGAPTQELSKPREHKFLRWLDHVKQDAAAIFLLGDLFDFWFEYKTVVPKHQVRVLGKLAEIADSGIPIYFFVGNHDLWMFGYFEDELGIPVFHKPQVFEFNNKKFFIGHGDGLGPGDHSYKLMKKVFANRFCQWLFARLHPNFGIGLAILSSQNSRKYKSDSGYTAKENEWLYAYANEKVKTEPCDYFVFGHRHIPMDLQLANGKSRYINLGEWFEKRSYLVVDEQEIKIQFFENEALSNNWQSPK